MRKLEIAPEREFAENIPWHDQVKEEATKFITTRAVNKKASSDERHTEEKREDK